ncbi:hypothetical protein BKH41_08525 [Helicobacter sp. 12S02232-10]|uniref:ArdC-like ssDNA-binding domain-containing protein n=1 Tax=Helicobacter sp. 12S02232-10 TaxID=1476197 RepID=UPI000BA69031|nr:ArdC family protein [Helicobacter sp. 12S02232-10]PAF46744.1 hypothetical protein BKH41_08525 [Helicobacter sp. 12S02232-10]
MENNNAINIQSEQLGKADNVIYLDNTLDNAKFQSSESIDEKPKNEDKKQNAPSPEAPNIAPSDMASQMEGYLRYIIGMACESKKAPWTKDKTAQEIQEDKLKKPFNPITGISYSGANQLALESQGKESGMWLTRKQIESLGGQIDTEKNEGIKTFFVNKQTNEIRYVRVYNVTDIENLDITQLPHQKMISIDKKPLLDLRGINLYPHTKKQISIYNQAIKNNTDYKVPLLEAPKKQEQSQTNGKGLSA